jgi:hypothetical protein
MPLVPAIWEQRMTEPLNLPEAIEEDGQLIWLPRMSHILVVEANVVYIDDTIRGEYTAERAREFGLALIAAANAAEGLA